jgi:hypothetical protein
MTGSREEMTSVGRMRAADTTRVGRVMITDRQGRDDFGDNK